MSARTVQTGRRRLALALSLVIAAALGSPASAQTLKTIKERGKLACGVSQGIAGFSAPAQNGDWAGFDVDFCRALAAAIFDDPQKVTFVPLSAEERFDALKSGKIDVLSRNSTWTMSREVDLGVAFAAVTYYDGQGFMAHQAKNVASAHDLGGSKVCVQAGTTTETNLADYFDAGGMQYEKIAAASVDELIKAYDGGRCDVLTSDASQLHALQLKLTKPEASVILPDIISKEPLGPVVRQGDEPWLNVVKWVAFAMVDAEELGVSSQTIGDALKSSKPEIKRLVGADGDYGERLGLTPDWVVRIVKAVGNYGEVYDRNVGIKTPLGIPRGINALWTTGGILYAPPIH
jgi:general L-amino acid transport system substrate-binding protein